MSIASFSIKRPIFISSLVIIMVITGFISLKRIGVDLFPDINIPFVVVSTVYPGAGPEEIETSISKPLEEELSSISGLKRITSRNQEGISMVFAEFNLTTDIKYAEQQVRDKTARVKPLFPESSKEPLVQRFDPSDQPIMRISLFADLPEGELYDLAKEKIKTKLEQVNNVGAVKIIGGSRREIHIELDRNKINAFQVPAISIGNQIKNSGVNIPAGKVEGGDKETSFRTVAKYESLSQIENTVVSFGGEFGRGVLVKDLGQVKDTLQDRQTLGMLYAPISAEEHDEPSIIGKLLFKYDAPKKERVQKKALFLDVYKQSGANTVEVADGILGKIDTINAQIKDLKGAPKVILIRDGSKWIRANIEDVTIAIILGILLAVIVVYLFLGNVRSTLITGMALPNSMLGAFIIMYAMGFTMNVMTLLALSLAVGLLVDDAIVVRENIFRKLEEGESVIVAARKGTEEVTLAVIGTSLTVIAVFLPIGFLSGIVGQFFKQFGLTVVFAMIISLFDGLTVAPMLSAYFAGKTDIHKKKNIVLRNFDKFQDFLDRMYGIIMKFALKKPWAVILLTFLTLVTSIFSLAFVKKTFLPANDQGEFMVNVEMAPGTSLHGTSETVEQIQNEIIKSIPELELLATVVGNSDGESNIATIGVALLPAEYRRRTTGDVKDQIREFLKAYPHARPKVNDYSAIGGGVQYPFNLNLKGENLKDLEAYSFKVMEELRKVPDLTDVDTTYRTGKPEFQVVPNRAKMQTVGVVAGVMGAELRYHIEGGEVAKYLENGIEYDVRLRLKEEQRNLRKSFYETRVPNIQNRLIPLSAIAEGKESSSPARIIREDRSRVVPINANLAPGGAIASASESAAKILKDKLPPPPGITYSFVGQSEDFKELLQNIVLAFGMALIFIYLVLASLYESFITPITILFAIPPAISGAFFALALTGEMLNLFSMIGLILLMGLVAKNSILLVDHAILAMKEHGMTRDEAIFDAGSKRLRPILMTSLAMIAGTLPIALGIGEASKSRTAMGIAIIGGLVLSTLITLIVVPAVFGYIDRLREKIEGAFRPDFEIRPEDLED
ncbi:MMPL family protein [Leptospira wolbachii serovar Codice str. CDC]|uniref:MMPL family protein n=1 Tax=Leptospira wolbachii serovar Codice str. CDC TaxID=1218599 RepID=R8ZYH2_9LEPT|nr:efflux RND transporter permease subunit [Leptospira wolbachii]EOQ95031.1 MMPL family protein [Leptospira wolbachii serovar Codice str. CDC]